MALYLKVGLFHWINANDSLKHCYMIQRISSVLFQDGLAAIQSERLAFSRQDRFLLIRRNSASRMLSNFFASATSRLVVRFATAFRVFAACLSFVDRLADASLTLLSALPALFFFKPGLLLDATARFLAFMLGGFGGAADVWLASCDGRLDEMCVGVGIACN
jgi:hypothetical protein